MRYHCHSNRKVSKTQITEVELLKRMHQLERRLKKMAPFLRTTNASWMILQQMDFQEK